MARPPARAAPVETGNMCVRSIQAVIAGIGGVALVVGHLACEQRNIPQIGMRRIRPCGQTTRQYLGFVVPERVAVLNVAAVLFSLGEVALAAAPGAPTLLISWDGLGTAVDKSDRAQTMLIAT